MKVFPGFRMLAALALGCAAVTPRADAQISFSATASATSIGVSNSLTYTITLTNTSVSLGFVTNALSGPVQFVSATPASDLVVTNSTTVIFSIDPTVTSIATLTVTVQSTGSGSIINAITAGVPDLGANAASATLTTQVTNAILAQADLAVSMTGPEQAVITNDYFAYGVLVTNLGPADATGVVLTNSLPPGVRLIGFEPSGLARTTYGSNEVFTLGTLTNGAFKQLSVRVQATNAGTWSFPATVGSANIVDPNPANNTASTNIVVGSYLSTDLVVSLVSTQIFDRQVTLMEQSVLLSNTGTSNLASVRVVVSGLTNSLANAVGTNDGKPFVVYGGTLSTNQSVNLLLQFYPNRKPFPFTNSQLRAYGVPAYDLAPPAALGTPVSVAEILQLPSSGGMLLQFPSFTNRTYMVIYSDDVTFSNTFVAQPPVLSQANWAEWIDYGPPTTLSHPTNTPARFYRVFLNP